MNIKSIYNKFFTQQKHNPYNEISFIIDADRVPNIKIYIENYGEDHAKELANLLFGLSRGYLTSSILETLVNLAKNNIDITLFIQKVISNWTDLDKIYQEQNTIIPDHTIEQPKIKPTSFLERFKNGS